MADRSDHSSRQLEQVVASSRSRESSDKDLAKMFPGHVTNDKSYKRRGKLCPWEGLHRLHLFMQCATILVRSRVSEASHMEENTCYIPEVMMVYP